MSRIVKIALCAAWVLLIALSLYPRADGKQEETEKQEEIEIQEETQEEMQEEEQDAGSVPLFPDLNASAITSISVTAGNRSFLFVAEDSRNVSVNGREADCDIYRTLVGQIASLPVYAQEAFATQDARLLLTLTVSAGDRQHTASFYEDDGTGETARIVAGTESAPQYAQTAGWRVGTLMMTCEGTRVEDEEGNEQPALAP